MQRIAVMPDKVEPNPYQPATRLAFTPEQLADLASVAEIGFIHTPVARRHPTEPGKFQMAVGWRRRCAWMLFRPSEKMPLDVDESLDDAAMFQHMVIENFDRLDPSAVEKGRLLEQYIAMGHTQAEAGQLFHMTQSGVSNLLRIIHNLPAPVIALVQDGKLPERHARQLIGLSKIKPAKAVEIAQAIAASTDPDQTLTDSLEDYLDKTGSDLREQSTFPMNWSPGMSADIEGQTEPLPACLGCPNYLSHDHDRFCARPMCMKAKQRLWIQAELARLSEKLYIPVAKPDEKAKALTIDWRNSEIARAILKRTAKPDCLRLVGRDERADTDYYLQQLIGSDDVLLASTDPDVLNREAEAKKAKDKPDKSSAAAKAADKPTAPQETEAQKAKRIERETREQEEKRAARSAIRKARYDLVWLILHTAEMLAVDMRIEGGILTWCADLTKRYTNSPQYEWDEYAVATEEMFEKFARLGRMMSKPLDLDGFEVRRYILVRMFASRISGFKAEEQFNWARGCERVSDVAGNLGLTLPAGWDRPPIHKTEANCHVCGVFTPGPAITGVDKHHGWMSVDGMVTCSSKCRAQLNDATDVVKPQATTKKVAGRSKSAAQKSAAQKPGAKKSQVKGKKK
jgi:ParB/RepB/Spo0J family partition protein